MPLHVRKAVLMDGNGDELLEKGIAYGALIAEDEDGPICLWGKWRESILDDVVYVWMLPVRETLPGLKFLRESRKFIDELKATARLLVGSCEPANDISYRWLFWLGFRAVGTFTVRGHEFLRMELRCGA
jgi:hypothetical protein